MSNKNFSSALFVLFILGFALQAYAYRFDPVYYQKRDFTFGASVGILPTFASPYVHAKGIPVTFVAEYRFAEIFSVGANVAFAATHFKSDLPEHAVIPREITSRQFQANVRAGLHHSVNRTDFYGGLMLGYFQSNNTTNIKTAIAGDPETPVLVAQTKRDGKFLYSAYIGVQQQITDRLGIYAEAGYSTTILQFGLSYKINPKATQRSKADMSLRAKSRRSYQSGSHCKSPGCKQAIR